MAYTSRCQGGLPYKSICYQWNQISLSSGYPQFSLVSGGSTKWKGWGHLHYLWVEAAGSLATWVLRRMCRKAPCLLDSLRLPLIGLHVSIRLFSTSNDLWGCAAHDLSLIALVAWLSTLLRGPCRQVALRLVSLIVCYSLLWIKFRLPHFQFWGYD